MGYITPYEYYTNNGVVPEDANQGSYQYATLRDIVRSFMTMYSGDDKLLNNIKRHEVIYHAKRGIKQLNFDVSSIKAVEVMVGDNLKFILPSDYVNWVRISMNVNGTLFQMHQNQSVNSALGYLQDNNLNLLFDSNGDVLTGDSNLDVSRLTQQQYFGPGAYDGCMGYNVDGAWYFNYRFGVDPSKMNSNPEFRINGGVIDFSSGVANKLIVLEYVSDGMENGDDTKIVVNKRAEEYIYRYIYSELIKYKINIPMYEKKSAQKLAKAEWNNAKIRMSGIHPSRLLMVLRGQGKWLK